MTEQQQPGGRQVLLVDACHITLEMARQTDHIRKFFTELLGTLDPTLSEKESKPMFFPHKSGSQQEQVLTHLWLRGVDHILLSVWPHGSLAFLEIVWSKPFSPGFCLGMIEDYFKTQDLHAHSLSLQADMRERVSLSSLPTMVQVG